MNTAGSNTTRSGRVTRALVTGGTGGIGAAVVRLLRRDGMEVTFTWHTDEAAATALAAETGARAVQADVTDAAQVAAAVKVATIHRRRSDDLSPPPLPLDVVVHTAGPSVPQMHLSTIPPTQFQAHLTQEAAGAFLVFSTSLPHLRSARGAIVAVTSAAVARHANRDGLSSIPKAAVGQLVHAIAAEEGRYGVRANAVAPGMLCDGMAADLRASGDLHEAALQVALRNTPLRHFGSVTDVAEAVAFLASPRARFVSGQTLAVDGGYSA